MFFSWTHKTRLLITETQNKHVWSCAMHCVGTIKGINAIKSPEETRSHGARSNVGDQPVDCRTWSMGI